MQAHVFAEGSHTTADDRELPIKEYYEGLFGMVAGLHDELSEFGDTELHVLSEEFGVATGNEQIATLYGDQQSQHGFDAMVDTAREDLLRVAGETDVMVVLLSTDVFEATVTDVWDDLVAAAKPESIWCLGAAQSALDELNFGELEAKGCTVVTYQRVGVARIGTETREELLETVEQEVET
jgi:hypothetical protein